MLDLLDTWINRHMDPALRRQLESESDESSSQEDRKVAALFRIREILKDRNRGPETPDS